MIRDFFCVSRAAHPVLPSGQAQAFPASERHEPFGITHAEVVRTPHNNRGGDTHATTLTRGLQKKMARINFN